MNKFYLLKYESANLGDDIQTIATMDILDDLNIKYSFVFRDLINGYFFNPLYNNYIIFNGWFSNGYGLEEYYTHPSLREKINITWPPKGNFTPILYSFHISEWGGLGKREVNGAFLNKESIKFYKSFNEVGCRDSHTLDVMKKLKVNSYFSGCITLTLNKEKYVDLERIKKNNICFVDIPEKFAKNIEDSVIKKYKNCNITYITHFINDTLMGTKERFSLARENLKNYCNAKLVITTRLHVLLPCLAFGTPVIFLADNEDMNNSRIKDYLSLSNVVTFDKVKNFDIDQYQENKYDKNLSIKIKDKFLKIIENIK